MSERVLFVDDEAAVLDGYQRMLHREFQVETENGGPQGLAAVRDRGPYAVVVSDMRMPGMDGVKFLTQVRELAPDTVRMVLTGYADIQSAMDAVNEGHIFRFLSKPCDKPTLAKALTTALLQYRLVNAEKELIENTLMGSIKVLTDVLSLVNPAAFGRSVRIKRYVRHIVKKLQLEAGWRFEVAAMLSQLGCVTLDTETIEAAYIGKKLSPEEQARYDTHPQVARDLLIHIPRLEPIAWMIGEQQSRPEQTKAGESGQAQQAILLGAQILKVAMAFDGLKIRGLSEREIIAELKSKSKDFDRKLVEALQDLEPESATMELRAVAVTDLRAGMILDEELRTNSGLLVVAKGQEINEPLIIRLRNFRSKKAIGETVLAMVPV